MWSYERELKEKRRRWWDDQMARRDLVGIKGIFLYIIRYLSCQTYKSLGETSCYETIGSKLYFVGQHLQNVIAPHSMVSTRL
jgi:hypothetical protein